MITKENENFRFKNCGDVNISNILDHINKFNSEWLINTIRQDIYEAHKYTNSFFLYESSNNWNQGDVYQTFAMTEDFVLLDLVNPVIKNLELLYDGKVGKVLFIKLPAFKEVGEHSDVGDYLGAVRRFHVPIITNPDVDFRIDSETINMKTGEIWEINNSKLHYVNNRSDKDRVHLLIDIMPNKYIGV
jgi:hypothetical protein